LFFFYFHIRYNLNVGAFYTNGIDDVFLTLPKPSKVNDKLTLLYAGNIGEGQGLHNIIPQLAVQLCNQIEIKVIGDGGRKTLLERAVKSLQCENVTLVAPMKRSELVQEYMDADVLFLHLNDYDAFKKVLPSKIFEYAATGKPILAGVSGYSAKFIDTCVINAKVFHPCDVLGAVSALGDLSVKRVNRRDFIERFSRKNIMDAFAKDIIQTVNGTLKVVDGHEKRVLAEES